MPKKANRPCTATGCGNFAVASGRCAIHNRQVEQRRGSSAGRGYDATWRRLRQMIIAEEPLCRLCLERGLIVASAEVDHIVQVVSLRNNRSAVWLGNQAAGREVIMGCWTGLASRGLLGVRGSNPLALEGRDRRGASCESPRVLGGGYRHERWPIRGSAKGLAATTSNKPYLAF